jgi:hypothetical protein
LYWIITPDVSKERDSSKEDIDTLESVTLRIVTTAPGSTRLLTTLSKALSELASDDMVDADNEVSTN